MKHINIRDPLEIASFITESLDRFALDEALGGLAGIPKNWIKIATTRLAGENSEVKEIQTRGGIKSFSGIDKFVHDGMKVLEQYSLVWLEIDGDPVASIIPAFNDKKYNVYFPDGAQFKQSKREEVRGTGKVVRQGGASQWIPVEYRTYKNPELNVRATLDTISSMVISIVRNMIGAEEGKGVDDAAFDNALKSLKFRIAGLTKDENRIGLAQDRKSSREIKNSDRPEIQNKINALKKYTKQSLGVLINGIKKKLPTEQDVDKMIDDALEGNKNAITFDQSFIDDIDKLSKVGRALSRAMANMPYNGGKFSVKKRYSSDNVSMYYPIEELTQAVKKALE